MSRSGRLGSNPPGSKFFSCNFFQTIYRCVGDRKCEAILLLVKLHCVHKVQTQGQVLVQVLFVREKNLVSDGIRTRILQLGVKQWRAISRDLNLHETASYHSSVGQSASHVQKWSVGFESSWQKFFSCNFFQTIYRCLGDRKCEAIILLVKSHCIHKVQTQG